MGKICSALAVLVALGFAGAAQAWSGNVNASIGSRSLDGDLWDAAELDRQPTVGVLADFRIADLPLHVAVGLQVSAEEEDEGPSEVVGAIADLSVGLKFMPASGVFRPYIGAGFASVGASMEVDDDLLSDDDDDDQSFGYYFGAGAIFRVTRHFNVGADARWIRGTEIELFGFETDADSVVVTVLAGFGWGE